MIVLEKWIPKKPISAIYYDGSKDKYFLKRFFVENENKEEVFISSHSSSRLEIVSTDWRPMIDVTFAKERGKERRANMIINVEEFINVKGITAQGNQLSKYKINQIDSLESLPYEAPKQIYANDIEVVAQQVLEISTNKDIGDIDEMEKGNDIGSIDEGQITLF